LNERNSSHAGLAQPNGFDLAFLHRALKLAKGTAKAQQRLTLAVHWLDGLTGPGGLLFTVPVSVLWVRLGKSK
jgi:hypothetical protein